MPLAKAIPCAGWGLRWHRELNREYVYIYIDIVSFFGDELERLAKPQGGMWARNVKIKPPVEGGKAMKS